MKNQIVSIQILRAIAAWLVVMHHFGKELTSSFGNFFEQQGNFGVDIFFVISGFIIFFVADGNTHGAGTFIVNRLFRVIPAYWLVTLAIVALKFIYPVEFSYTDWNIKTLVSSLLFIPVENPAGLGPFPLLIVGWTLNIEIFFYLLVTACFCLGKRYRFIACSLFLIMIPFFWDREWFYGSVLGTRKLCEFVLGIIISYTYIKITSLKEEILNTKIGLFISQNLASLGVITLVPAVSFLFLDRDGMRLLSAGLIVSGTLFFERYLSQNNLISKGLSKLGEMSYSTYLIHYIVIGVLIHYAGVPQNGLEEFFEWIVLISFIVVLSHLGFKYVECNRTLGQLRKSVLS